MRKPWTRRQFLAGADAAVVGTSLLDPRRLARTAMAAPPAEDGYELWLRYRLVADTARLRAYRQAFTHVVHPADTAILQSAEAEVVRGLAGLLGFDLQHRDIARVPPSARKRRASTNSKAFCRMQRGAKRVAL